MSFVNPQLFLILIVPLLFFTFVILRHKEKVNTIFKDEVLKRLSVGDDSLPVKVRNSLMLIAMFLFLIALARPVIDHGEQKVLLKGLSAVVALDISGSMRAKDIYPNRLAFAKTKMATLFEEMPTDELAVIAFAHSSFMLAPFSSDKGTLKQITQGVTDEYINMSSTDFTALGEYLGELLEKKTPKIVILFSDGGEKKELEAFQEIIKDEKISLYIVLVGTKEGSPVIDKEGKPLNHNGAIAITQRNDDLGTVALESGGAFVIAESGNSDIKELVKIIKAKHQDKEQGEVTIHEREELFYYPLAFGLFLLLLSFSSLPHRRNDAK
ncbi:MAG TPA: VWA domain-containing protein [Campylobacterales bacterium]|nr:VWA domain-containing protein [Campylobacterales bacterium]HHS91979.1 VWA domain-containing protein [Campylobacterales bacterium]